MVRRGSLLCLHTRLPFSESSAGPPTTSLRPEGFIAQAGTQADEEGSPTNVRCKAPHLIKIILAYSPKKERADPIEDESKGFLQGHFCPPPFSRNRTWTLPLIQLPAGKQEAGMESTDGEEVRSP